MIIRPGPESLPAGVCPGGVVVRVYGLDGTMLVERALVGPDEAVAAGIADGVAALGVAEIILVVYDGDTGRRWPGRPLVAGRSRSRR